MLKHFYHFIVVAIFFSCNEVKNQASNIRLIESKKICTNCQASNIHKVGTDKLLISFIKSSDNDLDILRLCSFEKGNISKPVTISSGNNWFVNWADIPSIVSLDRDGNSLMAHWLQMSAEGSYDYDIRCAISNNGGTQWDSSFVLHDDGIAAEHGFATMISTPKGAFVTWLDGRHTKTKNVLPQPKIDHNHNQKHDHDHGNNMPMTLRSAWFDNYGKKLNDIEIDSKVCDCCQTDAVLSTSGPIVVYRDRSDDEVRDISIARFTNGKWKHQFVHEDNWVIAGCPVNGPAIAYQNGLLALAWYTQMNDIPKVFLSLSKDDGVTFDDPILIDEGQVMGRVDIVIDSNKNVIVIWMESNDESAQINARILTDQFRLLEKQKLVESHNLRKVGFPKIKLLNDQLIMTRTCLKNDILSINMETFDY